MKTYKLHFRPLKVSAETEEEAIAWLFENMDKLEISLFEELEDERAKEFLSCLGNGKTIEQCESENDRIDEELEGGAE